MMHYLNKIFIIILLSGLGACNQTSNNKQAIHSTNEIKVTAKDILGNPDYLAISYGGYREKTRDIQPTIDELKEDMKILHAMGVRVLRTYNVQLQMVPNLLQAISELKTANSDFEMYIMLGAWIDCKNAWTELAPDHNVESAQNKGEIGRAVALAKKYPEIVKIIAVGNEAMVKWAESYFVQPSIILKWVNHLQNLKKSGELSEDLWITSSDDFASWGGADAEYHTEDLAKLMNAVDYVSIHSYPYHNSHYNPDFWYVPEEEEDIEYIDKINASMQRALEFTQSHYDSVSNYMSSLGIDKTIHIGETGWATVSNGHYGPEGSRATDEYKQGRFYDLLREWTKEAGISCFYFEAFNEKWKDANNHLGSENYFGLFTIDGKAKYPLWDLVDQGVFNGLTRNGNKITKTYNGSKKDLMKDVLVPPSKSGHMQVH
ncbi:MAG: exo-beta-1,3-glucanase (GH17 family) [Cyclobacteriaceae bacterium]|jgi:exo-beta-1,3-glucanase (GH17 family)